VWMALGAILLIYLLLSVQVIRWVPFGAGAGKAARYIQNEIGYNRVTLSMMLSGAAWAMLATAVLFPQWKYKLLIAGAAAGITFAQALTGGRTGYFAWLAVGFVLCLVRWRKFLPVLPIGMAVALAVVPGMKERVLQGFGTDSGPIVVGHDSYEMTSGRNVAWPAVIDQIQKDPWFGFGRTAMHTTGIADYLLRQHNESFPHPHQAYLEILLDAGLLGLACVLPFYLLVLGRATRALRDREDPLVCVAGAVCCALVLALIFGGFGGQTFYPREGSVGMWAAIGLMLRLSVERERQPEGLVLTEPDDEEELVVVEDEDGPRSGQLA
jgi:O-antigen ligase